MSTHTYVTHKRIDFYFEGILQFDLEILNEGFSNEVDYEWFFQIKEKNKSFELAYQNRKVIEWLKEEENALPIIEDYIHQLREEGTIGYEKWEGMIGDSICFHKHFVKALRGVRIEWIGPYFVNLLKKDYIETLTPKKSLAKETQIVKKAMDILYNDENRAFWAKHNPNWIETISYLAEDLTHSYDWDKDGVIRSALNKQ